MTTEWLKLKAAEAGASLLQSKAPLEQVHLHLCALHFYSGDVKRQVEAHHYCSCINDEVHQCLIFDSNEENARLIGVEYVVSERLFKTLPEDEKKLWHSHHYEVKSGMLVLPGVPSVAEHKFMEGFIKTYGKVFHFWQVDRGDPLPMGPPRLMMALTADDQLDKGLLDRVHGKLGIDTEACRKGREDIPVPEVDPGANSWEKGPAYQFELKEAATTTMPTALPGAGVYGSSASL
ncbi:DUF1264 domain protein [Acanthamoeba castellanii str. Neff]|uniref:DUF1264 domain protein n=1 Tax=Acanthamoeba castellanii (strain ATCC 30010 / Neff) TaxID=1257118 RepID=L8GQW4_ACACF|nr:DUF1264 domain protein [Acanthamoeba castellanii str. Neff]ELR15385.1 DUF1264 domain protein [Acanthamoeba castellanii str. Neff]